MYKAGVQADSGAFMNILQPVMVSLAFIISLASTSTSAELVSDPNFGDPASRVAGIGSSMVGNGHLVVINHSGFIFPEPRLTTEIGNTYLYTLTVDLVNNTSGGGRVTVGGQTIWEPKSMLREYLQGR
mgnify:CR=1 FL=1